MGQERTGDGGRTATEGTVPAPVLDSRHLASRTGELLRLETQPRIGLSLGKGTRPAWASAAQPAH